MFGIGFGELLIILIVALVFLGPEQLPVVARKVLRGAAELRRQVDSLTKETRDELGEVRHELEASLSEPEPTEAPPAPKSEPPSEDAPKQAP